MKAKGHELYSFHKSQGASPPNFHLLTKTQGKRPVFIHVPGKAFVFARLTARCCLERSSEVLVYKRWHAFRHLGSMLVYFCLAPNFPTFSHVLMKTRAKGPFWFMPRDKKRVRFLFLCFWSAGERAAGVDGLQEPGGGGAEDGAAGGLQ